MKEFDKKSSPSREGFSKFLPASMSDSSTRRRLTEYEIQVQDLQAYIRSLEAETVHLRKKLEDTPKDFMVLENKLREANRQLVQAFNQNEKLVNALYEAREQITALKEEVDKLCAPPSTYGVYLAANEDSTVTILSQGRKVKVNLHPSLKPEMLKPGQELILNEGLNVIEAAGYEIQGEVVILKEQLDAERALVTLRADEEKVGIIAEPLRTLRLKTGDHLLLDAKSGYLLEKLPKSEVEDLTLEEVPDIGYEDIGGLGEQIRPSRTRWSCRTSTPTTTRSTSSPRPRRAPLRPARLRQDHDRQGRRQQPRREDLREARREDQGLLPQHQGARTAE